MTAEIGHFAVLLAFVIAILQSVLPLIGAQKNWVGWMQFAVPAALLQAAAITLAFAALTVAFVTSDFSLRLVAANSHSAKPMLYKVSGVWGTMKGRFSYGF